MRGALPRLALAAPLLLPGFPSRAETLVTSLSAEVIAIHSNFTGADLALFGVVERESGAPAKEGNYDVVITVRGPRGSLVVREKKQIGPFWINADQRKYIAIPAYIAVLANRPLAAIAPLSVRENERLGMQTLVPAQAAKDRVVDLDEPSFRSALIRLRQQQHLFREIVPGVTFLTPSLFRAAIHVPGAAPLGAYDVNVTLLAGGVPVARSALKFSVQKSGFEQQLASAARERPILYGSATSALALLIGWLATLIFRRD